MNCPDLAQWELYAGDPAPAGDLEAHLAQCSACRDTLAEVNLNLDLARQVHACAPRLPLPAAVGGYPVLEEVGRGGMGVVYRAVDPVLQREVALKLLPSGPAGLARDPKRLALFEAEAQTLASFSHPHIATIYSLESAEGLHFITMEFVEGGSLARRLDGGPLPPDACLRLGWQLASALEAAHAHGILHGDLKPHNVMLPADGQAKLLDFGLAVAVDTPSGGSPRGTPGYMAPEVAAGGGISVASDLYGWGSVLAECLTGKRGEFTLPAATPPELAGLVRACLSPEPSRRPVPAAAVRQQLESALQGSGPRFVPPAGPPGNLPRPLTRFVGRERELAELAGWLDTSLVVTLTGVGGCGKSRLALEAGRLVQERFPGGVWLVQLAPLGSDGEVAPALAAALGVSERSGESPLDAALWRLSQAPALIILDNCEHVLRGSAETVRALAEAGRGPRVVCTSREPLGVPGERIRPVHSLDVPVSGQAGELASVDSVRLLLDRLQLVVPGFRLTAETAPALAEISRRLDGIPLALELAAARGRTLPVQEIASRLEDRFRLLTGGARTALPRHRTLRATVDWSYDLLTPAEQTVFARLSVFSGGWSLAAAEAVVEDRELPPLRVADALDALADKCLLDADRQGSARTGEPRYRLLETLRQYAQDRLVESGDSAVYRERHAAWFLDLAESGAAHLTGPAQAVWTRRLLADHDNLTRAIEVLLAAQDGRRALRLAGALGRLWDGAGLWTLGRNLLDQALRLDSGEPSLERVRALNWAGNLAMYQGELDRAERLHREVGEMARAIGDRWFEASSWNNLGCLASTRGRLADAQTCHERALAQRRRLGDGWAIGLSLYHLGVVRARREEYEYAEALLAEAEMHLGAGGDATTGILATLQRSLYPRATNDLARALDLAEVALARSRDCEQAWLQDECLLHVTRLRALSAQVPAALAGARALAQTYRVRRDIQGLANLLLAVAHICRAVTQPTLAARLVAAWERVQTGLHQIPTALEARELEALRAFTRPASGPELEPDPWSLLDRVLGELEAAPK